MANNDDLLKWTTCDVDFYSLMGLTFETCGESELKRAYRKTALKYHPDKLGDKFDPAAYELFNAAYEVLKDSGLKTRYDNHRNAKLQKKRADELFEGKRRAMKEELEARERGGVAKAGVGVKRPWEDDQQTEIRKLAEEGRKRRAAREEMMGGSGRAEAVPRSRSPEKQAPPIPSLNTAAQPEEDEVERLERRIREAEVAKAKRKAEKKAARKSGIFVSAAASPAVAQDENKNTPIKCPDIFKGLKADEKSSASPKFSFSPSNAKGTTPKTNDFAATMARLKAAELEKRRMEEEIRRREAEEVVQ